MSKNKIKKILAFGLLLAIVSNFLLPNNAAGIIALPQNNTLGIALPNAFASRFCANYSSKSKVSNGLMQPDLKNKTNSIKTIVKGETGKCGEDLRYVINGNTLTIYGSGGMYDYEPGTAPWSNFDLWAIKSKTDKAFYIGANAFSNLIHLDDVDLPNCISIGEGAFSGCRTLTSINLPDCEKVSYRAFFACANLGGEVIDLPNCETISEEAFADCYYIGENGFNLPKCKVIANKAFYNCNRGLKSIELPSVVHIGISAFEECMALNSISLPNKQISYIGDAAFNGCMLKKVVLSNNYVVSRFSSVFKGVEEVEIADGVTSISDRAFAGCYWLKDSINIPKSVTNIGANAFEGCIGLCSISMPSTQQIDDSAFSGCSALTSVIFSNNLNSLGNDAFTNCSSIKSITLPQNVSYIGLGCFDGCTKLNSIEVVSGNTNYEGIDGILFSKDETNLIRCPEGKSGDIVLCDNLLSIGPYAFSGCLGLNSISMREGIVKISDYAFKDCLGITSIDIPNSVIDFGSDVFSGCSNLTSVMLNNDYTVDNFKTIFPSTYSNFEKIILGDEITSINYYAFQNCTKLKSLKIGENTTLIGDSAFSGCANLNTVIIPRNVNKIYRQAFSNCKVLNNITISGNLVYVGEGAFSECTDLDNFTYEGTTAPRYDTGIDVFYNCPNLEKVNVPDNYEGNDFCGKITSKKNLEPSRGDKIWNVMTKYVFPSIGAIAGLCTVVGFIIKWKEIRDFCLSHCSCCTCCNRGVEDSTINDNLLEQA